MDGLAEIHITNLKLKKKQITLQHILIYIHIYIHIQIFIYVYKCAVPMLHHATIYILSKSNQSL